MNTSSLSTLCFAFSIFLSANAATTYGQITAKHLIGTSVETVDERYRDIDDAIVLFGRGNGAGALALLQAAKQKKS